MGDYPKISVVIPVGPNPVYLEWLPECIESVRNQTYPAHELFILSDQANIDVPVDAVEDLGDRIDIQNLVGPLNFHEIQEKFNGKREYYINPEKKQPFYFSFYESPWLLGVSTIFNVGVALAKNNCVFMLIS